MSSTPLAPRRKVAGFWGAGLPRLVITDQMQTQAKVIFDNGGGITVQLRAWKGGQVHYSYAHHFDNADDAAQLLHDGFHGEQSNWQTWEGNSSEAEALEPTEAEQSNGGYRVAVYMSWQEAVDDNSEEDRWANVRQWDAAIVDLDHTDAQ